MFYIKPNYDSLKDLSESEKKNQKEIIDNYISKVSVERKALISYVNIEKHNENPLQFL